MYTTKPVEKFYRFCCILLGGRDVIYMRSQNWERQVAMDNLEAQLVIEKAEIAFRYLLSIGVERQTAEDLTGEAIYKSILYFEGIEPEKLKAWLFRVALNGYYDLLRKGRKQHFDAADLVKVSQHLVQNQSHPVEDALLHKEMEERIAQTLAGLKKGLQEVLILRAQMDLSYQEISDYLDMPVDTVRTYLYRARKEFKKIWEEENDR
jgi:RNA polymerase sigma-70 factor (ECF subfamily)